MGKTADHHSFALAARVDSVKVECVGIICFEERASDARDEKLEGTVHAAATL